MQSCLTNCRSTDTSLHFTINMDVSNRRRIVILGKSGAGKSSLGNTIVGEKLFDIGGTANSETSKCRAETKSVNGGDITLIDTPGLFDTDRSEKELKPQIVKCIVECAPGPHAFLIVLKVERFTEHEQAVITKISQYFSEEVFKYATVLFTHGDQLEEEQTIQDFLRDNKLVGDLVKKCGGRCHVIDNKYWKNNQQDEYRSNQFQVKELLNTIEKMIEANKGSCYTNKMLQAVEAGIQQEEERIRQSPGNMSEEEIRKLAKDRVSERLLINWAGIATGALFGALYGGIVMVKEVVSALNVGLASAAGKAAAAAAATATAGASTAAAGAAVALEVGAAAAGAAAAGTAAVVAGTAAIAVTASCAAVGAVRGGIAGYLAAEGAKTPWEAAQMAASAAMKGNKSITDSTESKKKSE